MQFLYDVMISFLYFEILYTQYIKIFSIRTKFYSVKKTAKGVVK